MDANTETFCQIPDFPAEAWPFASPICPGLYATYAIDPGPSWETVQVGDVEGYGGGEALQAKALANLRQRGPIEAQVTGGRALLEVTNELDLSASLLLDPERWLEGLELGSELVVAVPTRIAIMVCAATDSESVATLTEAAREHFTQGDGKPVSPDLYRLSLAGLAPLA
jgi:hypothetical protein